MTTKEFEDLLVHVGDYGKYQQLFVYFILIPTSYFIAIMVDGIIFQMLIPERYWCDPPGRELTNYTQQEWWNLTVPRAANGELEKCLQYDFEVIELHPTSHYVSVPDNKTKECPSSWAHDRTAFDESVATTMKYLCDDEIYSTHIFSIDTAGNILGSFLLPIVADKFTGRRLMFFLASGFQVVFNILFLLVPYFGAMFLFRFLAGLSFQSNYQMPYVIGLELMSPEHRAAASFYSFVAWTAGMCSTALIAWLVPHWWYLLIICTIPSALFFAYWSFLPMSPRWLLSKGRLDECLEILMMVAKVNKKDVDKNTLEKELKLLSLREEKLNFKDIFKYKRVLFHAFLLIIYSTAVFMAYGCSLFNVKILPSNYYMSFFVLSLSELPSNVMSYLSVHYLGRRFTAIMTSIFAIAFCFMATFFIEERVSLLIVVAMIKIFATQGIYVVYVITCEVFPTPVRSVGIGTVVVAGMTGILVSKYIVEATGDGVFQYWIMLGVEVGALLFSLPLPETIGLPLPQTFPEAEILGKERPFLKWVHHWNKAQYMDKKEHLTDNKNINGNSNSNNNTTIF